MYQLHCRPKSPLFFFLVCLFHAAHADLNGCESLFLDQKLSNSPTLYSTPADIPFGSNVHLCYKADDAAFFAMEYWPERYSPRWTAYRIDGANFGIDGCKTYTRATGNCYINADTWAEPFTCEGSDRSDPFHQDHLLEAGLSPQAFTNSGHDRGHIAPRQAFSWHPCGAYRTFSMANMSPQSASINQGIWADLEQQVLKWGIEYGPFYVVSGTTYRSFPHQAFAVYKDGALSSHEIYPTNLTLREAAIQIQSNHTNHPPGHPLRPLRTANPERMQDSVRDIIVPTGYFKVIIRPAIDDQPMKAIGFLLPHSFENLKSLSDHYEGLDSDRAFWAFSARIDLIEQVSTIAFPMIDQSLKARWRDPWFFENKGAEEIRDSNCGIGEPTGVLLNVSRDERRGACF